MRFEIGDAFTDLDDQNIPVDKIQASKKWAEMEEKKLKEEERQLKLDGMKKATEAIVSEDQMSRSKSKIQKVK
ncbi:hypothetical protein HDU76_012016, partial [Blyttiomyces sp. JEL0837]